LARRSTKEGELVSKRTEDLIKWDEEHIIHPWAPIGHTQLKLVIEKGHGVWLQDTEGKQYIDMAAQMGYCVLGWGQREIHDAMLEQMNNIEVNHITFGLSNTKTIEYAQELAKVTPEGLDRFFFCSGGSEAVDTAFKLARLYWSLQGKNRWKIICFYGGFHGLSGGCTWASSAGKGMFLKGIGPQVPGFVYTPSYYCNRCMFGLKYPDCNVQCAQYLAEVIEGEGAENVAAFIAEPVMGNAGQVAPPPEYWSMVRKICDEHNILMIADEIQSGFSKTGKMFGLENWDVKPDIMVMAKAITNGYIPFAAVAVNDKVYQVLEGTHFFHGFTYCGHPTACAAALATLNILTRDKVADNAAKVGKHIMERLEAEFKPLPCVGGFSGLGLMIGMDIVADKTTKAALSPAIRNNIWRQMVEKGLLSRPIAGYGDIRLFICPPCVITVEEADKMLDILLPIIAAVKPS